MYIYVGEIWKWLICDAWIIYVDRDKPSFAIGRVV